MSGLFTFPVTYKVNVLQCTVGSWQQCFLQGMLDGWHGRGRLPLHNLSKARTSTMCQTHLTVKVTCTRALHVYMDGCSTSRLITSAGHGLHSTFNLVFVWDFLSGNFRHLCRTDWSVREREGKKHPQEVLQHMLWKTELIAMGVRAAEKLWVTRPWPESWHHCLETRMMCS